MSVRAKAFIAKRTGGNPVTIWLVNAYTDLPTDPGISEGDVGICINDGLFYQRDLNTNGWTLKFDPASLVGSITADDVVGLQAAVESFLSDELAAKADLAHTHAQGDVTGLIAALGGKAASVHTHTAGDLVSGTIAAARLGTGTADSGTFLRGDATWAAVPDPTITLSGDVTGSGATAITTTLASTVNANARVAVAKNSGAVIGTRRRINFVEGSNVTLTIADDSANEEIDVTISATSGGLADGDKGDVTVSGSGTTWSIDPGVVTYAKIQNVSTTDCVLGRFTAGSGSIEEFTCTAAGRALLDDANAAAQRSTLNLGSVAVLNTNATATNFLDGTGTWDTVKDEDLSLSDVTTGNVSTTAHGFVPKAPNSTSQFLRGDATWATISATLSSSSAFATAETTISTATYADITGCSVSLAAGTWLLLGQVNARAVNAIIQVFVALTDGANTVISEVAASRPASGTASLNSPISCTVVGLVSPSTTTTYKLRGARGLTTHTTSWIAMDGNGVNTTNHASNNTDKGCGIVAVKIA